jgi:pimeloyl-ACP methyl ester carboxylesterase
VRTFDVKVDITGAVGLDDKLETAATVYLPNRLDGPVTVLFGFPGGGYGRKYYDIRALPGYSQAEYHTDRGFAFVACDHLGVGESSQPDPFSLSFERIAAANHATATTILDWIQDGAVADGVAPIAVDKVIAMGQSMGGCFLTVQQATHRTFDGVALLGWSGIHTNFPAPGGGRITYGVPPRGTDLLAMADRLLEVSAPDADQFRFCFHWPDEDPQLVEADLASYQPFTEIVRGDSTTPWGSSTIPPCAITMLAAGAVAEDAAAIDVPVLIGCGERDVVGDPWAEPTAYRGSGDVSVFVVDGMSHMHNFALTRQLLWDRITSFAQSAG